MKIITALILVFGVNSIIFADGFKPEEGQFNQENYNKKYLNYIKKSCEEKGKSFCSHLGNMYADGEKGVQQDYKQAVKYYKLACQKEETAKFVDEFGLVKYSCFHLGVMYGKGEGVRQDYKQAVHYYKQAYQKGQATGCFNLGIMYSEGKGIRQDYKLAIKFYKKACQKENPYGCNGLGTMYYKGQGVRQNKKIAKNYAGKACDLGDQSGCDNYRLLNE